MVDILTRTVCKSCSCDMRGARKEMWAIGRQSIHSGSLKLQLTDVTTRVLDNIYGLFEVSQ